MLALCKSEMNNMTVKREKKWVKTTRKISALERSAVFIGLFAVVMISLSSMVPTANELEVNTSDNENEGSQKQVVPFANFTGVQLGNATVGYTASTIPSVTHPGLTYSVAAYGTFSSTRVTFPQKPKIYILVDEGIYGSITIELNRYMSDLRTERDYEPVLYHRQWIDEVEVKDLLVNGFNNFNLAGALFVGNIPVAYYEMDDNFPGEPVRHVSFPMDLFYMDVDGLWDDLDSDGSYDVHLDGTGDRAPDIFVGRLYASTVNIPGEDEISLIQNYFRKNHEYRTGNLPLQKRALIYVDTPWLLWSQRFDADVGQLYPDHLRYDDSIGTTDAATYEIGLQADYEWISVLSHSNQYKHTFVNSAGGSEGEVQSAQVSQTDPTSHFYSLHACRAARYTYAINNGYIGGHYIFAETNGVCAVGQTKDGGMWYTADFYLALAQGDNIGEAFIFWFANNGWRATSEIPNPDDWSYGMTILGDPTLVPNMP
jgi:hypothetical protein